MGACASRLSPDPYEFVEAQPLRDVMQSEFLRSLGATSERVANPPEQSVSREQTKMDAIAELAETVAQTVCESVLREYWRTRYFAWIRVSTACVCLGGGMHKGICFLGAL